MAELQNIRLRGKVMHNKRYWEVELSENGTIIDRKCARLAGYDISSPAELAARVLRLGAFASFDALAIDKETVH